MIGGREAAILKVVAVEDIPFVLYGGIPRIAVGESVRFEGDIGGTGERLFLVSLSFNRNIAKSIVRALSRKRLTVVRLVAVTGLLPAFPGRSG
mgnify:CR=1 FL=1